MEQYPKKADRKFSFHHREIHALFEELIHRPWGHAVWQPRIDILEEETGFRITADLPGIDAENIEIRVSGSRILIEGRRLPEKDHKEEKLLVCERPRGIFCREIDFFERLSETDIQTDYEAGVLTIFVKKATA